MDKRIMTLIMLLVAIAMGTKVMAAEKEAYAVYTLTDRTLSFYYDDRKSEREGDKYSLNTGYSTPGWIGDGKKFVRVVFAQSFADYRPTSTYQWFFEQTDLTTVDQPRYLHTDNVMTMYCMFYKCSSLETLDVSQWNTGNVIDMGKMFEGCSSLKYLSVSTWDTSNVNNMCLLFRGCKALQSLNLRNWDTSKVTDMSQMFYACEGLQTLDLSNWDTSKVSRMQHMFFCCKKLEELDVSGWNTSNVTNMSFMFYMCASLSSLDVSGWDTSKVTTMWSMFYLCNTLSSLDVSGWDTSKVTNMQNLFYSCTSLTNLDVSGWNTGNVTDMRDMFAGYGHTIQTSLDVSGWNTSKVTDMRGMFDGCTNLANLDVSGWNTGEVTNMGNMFNGCEKLESLDVSGWNTSKVTDISGMFDGCTNLTNLDVSGWNTGEVTNMGLMFNGCEKLESLDVSNWNTSKVTYTAQMFCACKSLTSLDVSGWNTSKVTDMRGMFYGCISLTSLDVSNWNTSKVTNMAQMFYACKSLTSLDLSSWDTSNVERMTVMFNGCQALTTIYAGPTWTVGTETNSQDMFTHCENLCGSAGTTYDPDHTDGSYAHVDGGPSNPGYLSERIYNLWVGGTKVTSTNSQSLPATTGSVTYDGAKKTLTLNNATITVTGQSTHAISNGDPWEHSVDGIDGLTIEVIGNCRLNAQSVGLVVNGNTTLTGTGQLSVNAGEEGVWIEGKNLTSKVKRLAITAAREAVKGTGFGVLTIDASTFEVATSTPDLYHPIKDLFRMYLTDCRYADPGGAWKYADANKYYYDEDRGFMIFGDEDYRGKVLIEPSAAPVNYRLWVGGTRVTSANKDAISVASGTASYDPTTHRLTLNNANIVAEGYDDGISNGLPDLEGMADFKIVCIGTNNSIDAVNSDGYGLASYGNTTITGSRLGIKAYERGIFVADFRELNLLNADVYIEAGYPVYCGYNTFVYVRNSRLVADPGTSQNSPVVGAREFDLINSKYQDPDIDIDPDLLYYNEQAEKMYYDGYIYDGPILIVPTGGSIATGIEAMGNGQLTMDNSLPLYNLQGQRVSHPVKGQIYIQNGRKVKF